jgi:UDP-glucose 4-epimerase
LEKSQYLVDLNSGQICTYRTWHAHIYTFCNNREIFNVGGENLSLDEIALKVQKQVGKHLEIHHSHSDDLRSYRVDSSKILTKLGFKPIYSVEQAIIDLQSEFVNKKFQDSLENSMYFNIKRMKELSLA